MDRLLKSEWIERLEGLHISGPVEVEPVSVLPRPAEQCRLRTADYAPFDDVIEIVLEDETGQIRVIIDDPRIVWMEDEESHDRQVCIDTPTGRITVRETADCPMRTRQTL